MSCNGDTTDIIPDADARPVGNSWFLALYQQFSCWNRTDPNYRKLLVLATQPQQWLDDPILSERQPGS